MAGGASLGSIEFEIRAFAGDAENAIRQVISGLEELERTQGGQAASARQASGAAAAMDKALRGAGQSAKELSPAFRGFARDSGAAAQSASGLQNALAAWMRGAEEAGARADALKGRLLALLPNMSLNGKLTVDTSRAVAAMTAAAAIAGKLKGMLDAAGIGPGKGGSGGGGGGSGKSDQARKARETEWQKELDAQLKHLERLKRLGEISAAQEIAELERIATAYARTAEQKEAMDDRLFEARARGSDADFQREFEMMERRKRMGELTLARETRLLERLLEANRDHTERRAELERRLHEAAARRRDEEIAGTDKLGDALAAALRNRYESMRKAEEARLKEASDSWRQWADASVLAVQRQIDALNELTKTEDRAEEEAKKLRRLAAAKQLLEYTTDGENRERLLRDIRRQEEELAKWRRNNAAADERERLKAEQDAIRERAKTEQDAIARQTDAMNAAYAERMKDAAMRAEAERMMTKGSQKEILAVIKTFAPDYDAVGKTLGERLYKGMKKAGKDITAWLEDINRQICKTQRKAASAAAAAADAFYANRGLSPHTAAAPGPVTISPTYNFYVPAESPADTARRVAQTNLALASML